MRGGGRDSLVPSPPPQKTENEMKVHMYVCVSGGKKGWGRGEGGMAVHESVSER